MKPVRILWIDWGAGSQYAMPLKGRLKSARSSGFDLAELDVSCTPSKEETDRISRFIKTWSPTLLTLALSTGLLAPELGLFFGIARKNKWGMPVVALCQDAPQENEAALRRLGAREVLRGPFNEENVASVLSVFQHLAAEESSALAALRAKLGLSQIIGESPAFVARLQQIPTIAKYDASVLILGETGTGKEVFARAIHYQSPRTAKPFVPVNCGAIPVDLLENEFFGHESGAYTSANSSRRGVIHEADGGTLFLDEVDCLPPLAQVKLLRFLQDGYFRPLGSEGACSADVRVIAASNANIGSALESERFRKDLYYRLNVVSLKLPSLRERENDALLLARHFVKKYAEKFGAQACELSPSALLKIGSYQWPGNVRELENVIQGAVVLTEGTVIPPENIQLGDEPERSNQQTFQQLKAKAIVEFEQNYIRRLLLVHQGNITKAAQSAGKDRRAFWELMRKHRIAARPFLGEA